MAAAPVPADPRPVVDGETIVGSVCSACGHRSVRRADRCERCLGPTSAVAFGPRGTVWSATTVHIRVGEHTPPFVLAYVDLNDGPRILAHVEGAAEPPVGATVRVSGSSDGDVTVEAVVREAGS